MSVTIFGQSVFSSSLKENPTGLKNIQNFRMWGLQAKVDFLTEVRPETKDKDSVDRELEKTRKEINFYAKKYFNEQ